MHRRSSIVAGLLAVSILIFFPCTSFLEAQACKVSSAAQLPEHASGCLRHSSQPQHRSDLPSAPVSKQCCVNSHPAAIPTAVSSPRPALVRIIVADIEADPASIFLILGSSTTVIPNNSPPGASPLRI
jgi:hypothetical protein